MNWLPVLGVTITFATMAVGMLCYERIVRAERAALRSLLAAIEEGRRAMARDRTAIARERGSMARLVEVASRLPRCTRGVPATHLHALCHEIAEEFEHAACVMVIGRAITSPGGE